MAGPQDLYTFFEDFNGTVATFPTSADPATPWLVDDTSSSGTPTYTKGTSVATLKFASTNEIENVCLHFGDALDFDIDLIQRAEFYIKMAQAEADATTSVAFGLAAARNDAIDSIADHASFRVIGADSTTALVVETDDGTNDNDDKATGTTLINAYKRCVIDFTQGTSDVRFYVDGVRVASATTFDMSNYTAGLQPYIQLQKTADTNVDSVVCDYIRIDMKRA